MMKDKKKQQKKIVNKPNKKEFNKKTPKYMLQKSSHT